MKVFLLKTVDGIGASGEIKNVNDGYGKNFLIPNKMAVEYNDFTKKDLDNRLKKIKDHIKVETKKRTELSDQIESKKIYFYVKAKEDGSLYGSISAEEIAKSLKKEGINISENQVLIEKKIKELGTYNVQIKLSSTLKPMLKVRVVSEDLKQEKN